MKPGAIAVAALVFFAGAPCVLFADIIRTASGELEVFGLEIIRGSAVFETKDGKAHDVPIDKVESFELPHERELNDAELMRNQPAKAAELYRKAVRDAATSLAAEVARYRMISMLDASKQYGEAMQIFAPLYAAQPCEEVWRLRPMAMPKDNTAMELDMAATALKHATDSMRGEGIDKAEELLMEIFRRGGKDEERNMLADVIAKHKAANKAEAEELAKIEAAIADPAEREKYAVSVFKVKTTGAIRVAFVIDHSGSMIDTFDFLREEMRQLIKPLAAVQRFTIIEFSEKPDEFFPGRYRYTNATDDAKKDLDNFFDGTRAAGKNDDRLVPFADALRMAMTMKPDVIYFITDGNFNSGLVDEVKKLNKNNTVINTIAFMKASEASQKALKAIAESSKGQYAHITEEYFTRKK